VSEPATYGDVTAEYTALRTGAGVVAGAHDVVWVEGPDAVGFLDGILSQDVAGLLDGEVARSFLLEPRGKLRAVLWLLRGADRVALVADGGRGPGVAADLERFRFRVDATVTAETRPVATLVGPGAPAVLEAAGLREPGGWTEAEGVLVAATPLGGLDRYVVAGRGPEDLAEAGAVPAGGLAASAVRVEAGEPRMGYDVDERTIPHETGLVPLAVSFTKGCYLGQELVARIDSRGHVNRHLRGVAITENVLPPEGAALVADGDEVGRLTSVAESLAVRAPIGLALVRREVEPGAAVDVLWEGGTTRAVIRALPFDDFSFTDLEQDGTTMGPGSEEAR